MRTIVRVPCAAWYPRAIHNLYSVVDPQPRELRHAIQAVPHVSASHALAHIHSYTHRVRVGSIPTCTKNTSAEDGSLNLIGLVFGIVMWVMLSTQMCASVWSRQQKARLSGSPA
ncbi:uncharacterized protein B0H18DRAFT_1216076 [Fomitopsis serialis]|uniref:uncharacterized protein n=1 Tax=Fomitopsis serialis TaxID=139415 RepID=UPI00200803E0|nr:uncharacterized protein B0H18DRAFT_1216076 [Neoantrodia serialis]KAH9914333.1 hypothetical protein B0H18DRAFT_1216076 [Neoantrodia serialis]